LAHFTEVSSQNLLFSVNGDLNEHFLAFPQISYFARLGHALAFVDFWTKSTFRMKGKIPYFRENFLLKGKIFLWDVDFEPKIRDFDQIETLSRT
jgi:hypothetical protein